MICEMGVRCGLSILFSVLCGLDTRYKDGDQLIALPDDFSHLVRFTQLSSFDDVEPNESLPEFLQSNLHL